MDANQESLGQEVHKQGYTIKKSIMSNEQAAATKGELEMLRRDLNRRIDLSINIIKNLEDLVKKQEKSSSKKNLNIMEDKIESGDKK